LRPS